ncbi:MAG: Gfo/Idh/MocA family protein [Verrucomicrobiales bacterium]|nr:Gfo/Idh/MocA family oxidoreductase [Verrucomicrobiota bacterium JB025]
MNRRSFLEATCLAGAATAVGIGRAGAATPAANGRINVALIGANNMGGKTHLPTIVGSSECQLVAVCDVDAHVRRTAAANAEQIYATHKDKSGFKGVDTVEDFREVLAREDVDAVVIATPDHWHVPISKAAARAGKDVYVEKPMSLYIQEGRELADVVAENRTILQVGSQQRSDIRFWIARDIVSKGGLGQLQRVEVGIGARPGLNQQWQAQPVPDELNYDMWLGPVVWTDYHEKRVHYNFRFVPEFSGGDVTNWGAHHLDIAQWALDEDAGGPVAVEGTGERHPAGSVHSTYSKVDVTYRYANGLEVKLTSLPGVRKGVTFIGSEGSLFVTRGKLEANPRALLTTRSKGLEEALRTGGGHFANWLQCIRSRNPDQLRAPVEVGHRSATVCHLANIAMELRRPLEWDATREIFRNDAHANALLTRPTRPEWRI